MSKLSGKQRSFLIGKAAGIKNEFQLGKEGISPSFTNSIREALEKNELIKIKVLKTAPGEKEEIAGIISERTQSEVVTVIGNKIVLFKYQKDRDKRKIDI